VSVDLPDAVVELLATRIDSFEKLDVVIALHAAPGATMTVHDLCSALKLPRDVVRQAAVELRGNTLVELTARGEVRLLLDRDRVALSELVRLHAEDRFSVAKALGDLAVERIRNLASQTLVSGFVPRKSDPDVDD
jgi:hypothetical protein